MPHSLAHRASSLPAGILDRDHFFARVDEVAAAGSGGDLGIACLHVAHLRDYGMRVGVEAGDALVAEVYDRLSSHLAEGLVARDGDFAFLGLMHAGSIKAIFDSLIALLKGREGFDDVEMKLGFCLLTEGSSARTVAERARFAYQSIQYDQQVRVRLFDDALRLAFDKQRYVVECLDEAIARGEIRAYAQPIVRVVSGRVCEAEILARWHSERFGVIMPDEFIPRLERSRLIHKLDAAIVRIACAEWHEAADLGIPLPFGINLSRLDFELCDIYQVVRDAMEVHGVPVSALHIEVTESAATGNEDLLRAGIESFRKAGFKLYMDDFGTGYSSLAGLRDSSFDVVKLDMSLISDIECNERSRVVVADAVSMAKRLGMQTLCEGVETLEQLRFLRMVGCEKAQGWFFGKPMAREDALARLVNERARYEDPQFSHYLDQVGRVNLIDGTQANVQGVEAAVILGSEPVAVVETVGNRISCLLNNAAFSRFLKQMGVSSFEEALGRISEGTGELRTRMLMAAHQAKETGSRTSVDLSAGGSFGTVRFAHVASNAERDGYLVTASVVSANEGFTRDRNFGQAVPFLLSIYKRLDLFDLETGESRNIYLNAPLLRTSRTEGMIHDEVMEFGDRNVHPSDRERFNDFYDLSTLDERVRQQGSNHAAINLRTRVPGGDYVDHVYTLIPMVVDGHRKVLSTLRASDVGMMAGYRVSGDSRISDTTLLQAVLAGTDRYVFWKDDQRRFLGANQAFLDYYGFASIDDIAGKTDDEVGWHVDNAPFRDDELRVLAGEVVLRARGTCYDRNELRKIEANKRPIVVSGEVVGLLGYFRDLGPAEEERRPF